jgi:alpha-tubulin suppressor-like RCC1 family protein
MFHTVALRKNIWQKPPKLRVRFSAGKLTPKFTIMEIENPMFQKIFETIIIFSTILIQPNALAMQDAFLPNQIAIGGDHYFVTFDAGEVFSWGNGRYGLGLGHEDKRVYDFPKKVEALSNRNITHIAAGYSHTLALTDQGEVFAFGYQHLGGLGLGQFVIESMPKKIESISDKFVIQVATGISHSLVLTREGEVISFGGGNFGQLGNGDRETHNWEPAKVTALSEIEVIQISAGGSQSLALTNNGEVFFWGKTLSNQESDGQTLPKRIEELSDKHIVQISSGMSHSLALSQDGEVYSWGKGDFGRLGHGDLNNQPLPIKIESLAGIKITQAWAGHFSLAISDQGDVYYWGLPNIRELTDYMLKSTRVNHSIPRKIEQFSGVKMLNGAAGTIGLLISEDKEIYSIKFKLNSSNRDAQIKTEKVVLGF